MFQDSSSIAAAAPVAPNICPRCGGRFTCGMEAGAARCWCAELPRLVAVPAEDAVGGCYCPACLEALLAGLGGETPR